MRLLVGLDDHDSPVGGCTTHFTTLFIKSVLTGELRAKILGLPRLVRLNPVIPWKTRGNAATVVEIEHEDPKEVFDFLVNLTETYDREVSRGLSLGRRPGAVVIEDRAENLNYLRWVYKKALTDVVAPDVAEKVVVRLNGLYMKSRGSIGSLAALGFSPEEGFTYELIFYRDLSKGRPENVEFVKRLEESYFPRIFYNYDFQKKEVIAEPRGNDPVLIGIRGVDHAVLLEKVRSEVLSELRDYVKGAMLFVTNQHTGAHVREKSTVRPYRTLVLRGTVESKEILSGGDVRLSVISDEGGLVTVFVFRETGILAKVAQKLESGDVIRIEGAVKPSSSFGSIVEAEAIEVLSLNSARLVNPPCPLCGGPTESLGRGKGLRCKKCGYRFGSTKIPVEIKRDLSLGKVVSSRPRHLTELPYVKVPRVLPDLDLYTVLTTLLSTG